MKTIPKVVKAGAGEYFVRHLNIINNLLPATLTTKEIEVLAAFMSADRILVEDYRFNTVVRKKVMKDLNLSPGGLSNYLKSMIKKGFISKANNSQKLKIKPFLFPEDKQQKYHIALIKHDTDK